MCKMPGYGFTFHIRVGCEIYLFRGLGLPAYILQHLSPSSQGYILRLEIVLHVHAKLALWQVPYVAVGSHYFIFTAEKFPYRLCLGRRLHDNKHF